MRVAVIDSGVHTMHLHIGRIAGGVTIAERSVNRTELDDIDAFLDTPLDGAELNLHTGPQLRLKDADREILGFRRLFLDRHKNWTFSAAGLGALSPGW